MGDFDETNRKLIILLNVVYDFIYLLVFVSLLIIILFSLSCHGISQFKIEMSL